MTSTASSVEIGASFGAYRILRLIGSGPTGSVYLAEWSERSDPVALKVFGPGLTHPGRFLGDCELVAELEHPAVLRLYDWGEIEGATYVATRYVEGSTLESVLNDGPLPTEQTRAIVEHVAGALHAAHCCGVVHRDLKPSNVLLEAESDRVFVSDFGVGGPVSAYSAPERAEGKRLDGRSDVYSLGRVLADCVQDGDLAAVVAKATAQDRTERYAMTVELADACGHALPRHPPAKAAPAPVVEEPQLDQEPDEPKDEEAPGGRRRRLWLVAGGGLAVCGAAALLAAALGGGGGHESTQPSASPPAPSALSLAQPVMTARTQGVGRAVRAAVALPLVAPPLYDVVAFSGGTGVRYRSSPAQWCGDAPPTDPCWNGVVPGAGAAEGQQRRVYCYMQGAPVHGNSWWARVSEQPAEYVPATFLRTSHKAPPANVPLC
jgi:hypothetical protein